jgi:hypothetical protein
MQLVQSRHTPSESLLWGPIYAPSPTNESKRYSRGTVGVHLAKAIHHCCDTRGNFEQKDGLLCDVAAQLKRKDERWAESVKLANLFGIIITKTKRVERCAWPMRGTPSWQATCRAYSLRLSMLELNNPVRHVVTIVVDRERSVVSLIPSCSYPSNIAIRSPNWSFVRRPIQDTTILMPTHLPMLEKVTTLCPTVWIAESKPMYERGLTLRATQ